MLLTVLLLSIFVFIKTIGYGIYEYREQSNKPSAIIICILGVVSLIAPCVITII